MYSLYIKYKIDNFEKKTILFYLILFFQNKTNLHQNYKITIFLSVFLLIIVLFIFSMLFFKISLSTNYFSKIPYECGFVGISNIKVGYSSEFFLVVFCFIFFDLEIILILPFLLGGIYFSFLFILILLLLIFVFFYEFSKRTFVFNSNFRIYVIFIF